MPRMVDRISESLVSFSQVLKKCLTRPDDGGIGVGSLFLKNVLISMSLTRSPRSPISSEVQVEL